MSSSTTSSSRPVYSPSQLLSLQSKAAQLPGGALPDLACVSTSPTSPSVTLPSILPPPLNRRTSSTQGRDFGISPAASSYAGGAGAATTTGSSAWRSAGAAGLPPKPIHSISSSSTNPVPLFQQTPKPTKVTIRSPNSTSPPTPISPASPPPVVASPTSPAHSSSTSSTPLFQQARASRVSIKLPSPKEDAVNVGVKSSPTVTRIPGSGAGAAGESRPFIPPSLPSSSSSSISSSPPSQENRSNVVDGASLIDLDAKVEPQAAAAVVSPPPPARTFGVDDLDLAGLSFASSPSPSELAPTTSTSTIVAPAPQPIPSIMDSPAEELSGWEVPSPSTSSSQVDVDVDATFPSPSPSPPQQTLSAPSPPTSKLISPLASPPQSPAPPPPTRAATGDDDGKLVSSAAIIPTPPASPATPLAAEGGARVQRVAGSTPSGRMIAGALGLSRDRTGGVAGGGGGAGGGYVRPEVRTERKFSGKELDDKILKIREENRRIEAEHEKEKVDALVHSPTRSREASVDEQTGLEGGGEEREMKRASAQRRLSQAETEIERLKRELDRAVQTKIDTEREVARERKLKAAGSGSLDWDASKSPTSPDLQSLPFEKQPSPTYFNKPSTSPLASPYERPSRPRFPSDAASPDGRRISSGSIVVEEEQDDGGWGEGGGKGGGDATPTRSLTPIANSTPSAANLLTPKPTPVKFKVGSGSSSSAAKTSNLPRNMPDSSGSSGKGSPFLVQNKEEEASSEVPVGWEVQEGLAGEDEDDEEDEETGGWGV